MLKRSAAASGIFALGLTACGGGGSNATPPPPTTQTYSVAATVSGLNGSGLVLSDNGSDNLTVTGNGVATFVTVLASGHAYSVAVTTQPTSPSQTCTVANGSGTIGSANVTNVTVSCVNATYPLSVTVSGLKGSGLVIQNNFADDLAVSAASGTATFATPLASGSAYGIAILSQPSNPVQKCTVTNGSGTVVSAPITTPTIACATQFAQSMITINYADNSLSLFLIDGVTGQPRHRGRTKTEARPSFAVGDGQGRYVYVLNSGSVSAFKADAQTMSLIPVGQGAYLPGAGPDALVASPNSHTLYVTNGSSGDVSAFTIVQSTGELSTVAGSPFKAGTTPGGIVVDAANRFAYVTNKDSTDIYTYSIDPGNGALTEVPGSRVPSGPAPYDLLLHRTGKFAYLASVGQPAISGYLVNAATGILTPMPGSPFTTSGVPGDTTFFNSGREPLLMHPNGKLLFVRSTQSKTVSVMLIDAATGALTAAPGSPYVVRDGAVWFTLDPTGQFLYVANRGNNPLSSGSISAFQVNAGTGALTEITGSPFLLAGGPSMVNVDPSGKFLYASSQTTDLVYGMNIDQTTGALTPLASGAQMLTGDGPIAVGTEPDFAATAVDTYESKRIYVPNLADNSITSYAADPVSGALAPLAGSPFGVATGSGLSSMVLHSSNLFAYTTNTTSGTVSQFSISPADGVLFPNSNPPVSLGSGAAPNLITTDVAGQYAYVLDPANQRIDGYTIDPVSGALGANYNAVTLTSAPIAFALSGSGRFGYLIRDGGLDYYTINDAGILSGGPQIISRGLASTPSSLVVHPNGYFVYVSRPTTPGAIDAVAFDPYSGSPGPVTTVTAGTAPLGIAIEPTGHFLYSANSGSNDISIFSIDQGSGVLTAIPGTVGTGNHPVSLVVSAGGKYLYVVNSGDKNTWTYSIDASTGALTPVGSPVATGNSPGTLVASFDVVSH